MNTLTYSRPVLCPVSHYATVSTASAYAPLPRRHDMTLVSPDVLATLLLVAAFVVACGLWLAAVRL